MNQPLTDQQLDEIEARAGALNGRGLAKFTVRGPEDVKALVAEVRRLRAELADQRAETQKLIRWHGEDETAMAEMRSTIQRLRARTLTESEHNRAWHAIEGAAGEEGADPGTVLNAVLRALDLNPPAACPGFEKEYQGVSDAKRRLANCKHCGQPRTAHAAARSVPAV